MLIFTTCSIFLLSLILYIQKNKLSKLEQKYNVLCNVLAGEIDGAKIIGELTEGKRTPNTNDFKLDEDFPLTYNELEYIRKIIIKEKDKIVITNNLWSNVETLWLDNTIFLGDFRGNKGIYFKTQKYIWKIYGEKAEDFMRYNNFVEKNEILCSIILDPPRVSKLLADFRK